MACVPEKILNRHCHDGDDDDNDNDDNDSDECDDDGNDDDDNKPAATPGTHLTLLKMLRELPTGGALAKDDDDSDGDDDDEEDDGDYDGDEYSEFRLISRKQLVQFENQVATNMVTSVCCNLVGKVPKKKLVRPQPETMPGLPSYL